MNYLAHTLLSKATTDYQLGNLLADPLKGKSWSGCSSAVAEGFRMHVAIDAFTDSHEVVKRAKARLGDKGYLKGVIVDITFDHFLTKHWDLFVAAEFELFIATFNRTARQHIASAPPAARQFIERITTYNILAGYREFEDLALTFERLNRRLSARVLQKESATDYIPRLKTNLDALEEDFLQFFPDLVAMFLQKSGATNSEHVFKIGAH